MTSPFNTGTGDGKVMPIDTPLTMSSREIAELLNVRHDSVKRTMERLRDDALIRFTPSVETSHSGAGARPVEVYLVNERDSYVVVARLSPEFTARLVDFWQAHKPQVVSFNIPTTLSEALRLAADQADTIDRQSVAIATLAPKAQFHDDVAIAVNSQTFMDVAKILGTGRTRFTAWLRERGFLQKNNRPYQQYEDAGYFKVVEKKRKGPDTGEVFTYPQTLVTGKGVTYLHCKWMEDHPQAQTSLALTVGEGK